MTPSPVHDLPENAVRMHLYNVENLLKPRGTMQKESLSLNVSEILIDIYESWSDPNYGDSIREGYVLLHLILNNMREETDRAFAKLLDHVARKDPEAVKQFMESIHT